MKIGATMAALLAGTLLALALPLAAREPAPPPPTTPAWENYSDTRGGITLRKPRGWRVTVANGEIRLAPAADTATAVFLVPILRAHPRMTAVSFLHFIAGEAVTRYPDLRLGERRMNRDNTVAEVTAAYTDPARGAIRGLYLVSISGGRGLYCGYEAPTAGFDPEAAVLRHVLASFTLQPAAFAAATQSETLPAAGAGPTLDANRLVTRAGSDETMFIAVPPEWEVGGGNYVFVANSADRKLGVFQTNDHQPGAGVTPEGYLTGRLLPFFACTGTELTGREPNREAMAAARQQGLACEAVNFTGRTVSGDGQAVEFVIGVQNFSQPWGGGWVSCTGIFGVPELFARNAPVLLAMALSIAPNQSEIMGRLRENLDRLGQASRTMSATGDVVIAGLRSATATTDRALDRYNYYLSGEEARYSPADNRIYVIDSRLADYAANSSAFTGQLTDVPDHLWNQLPHERIP